MSRPGPVSDHPRTKSPQRDLAVTGDGLPAARAAVRHVRWLVVMEATERAGARIEPAVYFVTRLLL
jgi:hypothetical protein